MARRKITRRSFVAGAGQAALGAMVLPRRILGGPGYQAPSDTLHVAVVGAGGMGMNNAEALVSENIVAVCDIDFGYVERGLTGREKNREGQPRPEGIRLQEQLGKATRYADLREMLDRQKDIDAVVIATPDHNHAVIAKSAMQLGKHVYVQKPLTYSVHEARMLRELAIGNPKLATQMGNQGHSRDGARLINEWIQAGVIGPVREVHVWTNRPMGIGPRASRAPRPRPPMAMDRPPSALRGACGGSTKPSPPPWGRHRSKSRRVCTGTSSSARSPRTSPTIRSITHSTGGGGWTSAWAPWATWGPISSIIRSGRSGSSIR